MDSVRVTQAPMPSPIVTPSSSKLHSTITEEHPMPIETSASELIDARAEEVGMSSERLRNVTQLVQGYVNDGKFAGAISMIARHDRVVHFETYGNMDDEAAKPMHPDTIVRAYSMTKPIASVALMQLYEQALFQLDDPVSAYVPEFAELKVIDGGDEHDYRVRKPAREMTVRDVLMHTSGLVGRADQTAVGQLYAAAGLRGSESAGTLHDMIRKVGELPLHCDPGSESRGSDSTATSISISSGRSACPIPASTSASPSSSVSPPATSATTRRLRTMGRAASATAFKTRPPAANTRSRIHTIPAPAASSQPHPITCASAACLPTEGNWTASD
jgi:CubicO group peptidase (beta-lactamase class C family)